MKLLLLLCYCFVVLPIFSQKVSEQELKRYEWTIYNKDVADSSGVFSSDTLLLAKSYDLEFTDLPTWKNNRELDGSYSRRWQINFVSESLESNGEINEFYVFFIDLRKAAMRRRMEVDSITYQLLQNPNALTTETSPALSELNKMQNGDVVQIVDSIHNKSYYIEKKLDKLQVLKTLRRRSILEPKGVNQGFWTFSKRNQLITFNDYTGGIKFLFRVEHLDNIRIQLIRIGAKMP